MYSINVLTKVYKKIIYIKYRRNKFYDQWKKKQFKKVIENKCQLSFWHITSAIFFLQIVYGCILYNVTNDVLMYAQWVSTWKTRLIALTQDNACQDQGHKLALAGRVKVRAASGEKSFNTTYTRNSVLKKLETRSFENCS